MHETTVPAVAGYLSRPRLQAAESVSNAIVLLLALAVFINYCDRGNLATAAPLIQEELHLTNAQIGLLLSGFFWSYAPAQLLSGWLAHRFDVRYVLALGLAVWSAATVATGLTTGFVAIFLLRLLLGLGESAFYPCNARLLAQYAPEHQRGRANGFVVTGQALGPTLGTLVGGVLMAHYGWRAVFAVFGLISLSWLWPWLRTSRRALGTAAGAQSGAESVSYLRVLAQPAAWACGMGSFLSFYGYYLVLTWLPLYLVKARGFSVTQMAQLGAMIYCMHALSSPLVGWASDRWIRGGASVNRLRKSLIVIGSLTVAVGMLLCNQAGPTLCIVLLSVIGFFFGFVNPQIFAIAQTLGGPRAAGKWMALQNMLGNLAGIVAPLVTGIIVDRTGHYLWAFALGAGTAVLAAITWSLAVRRVEPVAWDDNEAIASDTRSASH
jgi:MFS family permease